MPNTLYQSLSEKSRAAAGMRTARVFSMGAQTVDAQLSGGGILRGLPISGDVELNDLVYVQFDGEKYIARAGAQGRKASPSRSSTRPPCIAPKSALAPVNPITTSMHIRAGECFDELSVGQGFLTFDTLNISRATLSLTSSYQLAFIASVFGVEGASYKLKSILFATIFDNCVAGDVVTAQVNIDDAEFYTLDLIAPQISAANWSYQQQIEQKVQLSAGQHTIFVKAKNQTAPRGKVALCHVVEISL